MIDFENKPIYDIFDLIRIMSLLRGPGGCPWDREQTHGSIKRNLLEEAFEAASAIDEGNAEDLKEELGDVLLQVLFHADIARDEGSFTFDDIIDGTCKKLLRRHPHVFNISTSKLNGISVKSGNESISVWEEVKREEKQHETVADSMDAVASALPALWRAEKIQKKAAKAGFDWPDYTGALEALRSEIQEAESAIAGGDTKAIKEELGDLLFSAVNIARFFGINPEDALNDSSKKFTSRFRRIEEYAAKNGKELSGMTLDEMEEIYQSAKNPDR